MAIMTDPVIIIPKDRDKIVNYLRKIKEALYSWCHCIRGKKHALTIFLLTEIMWKQLY